jgi:regulator of protease activity HflC (stomatin/prohibitin superfamily)
MLPSGSPRIGPMLLAAAAAIVMIGALVFVISGRAGMSKIEADEVGVKINYMTGSAEVINKPGIQIYMPVMQEIFTFDKSPQSFLMEGRKFVNDNHVPYLTVRAKDGSSFWFETLEILYQIVPSQADLVLEDSGPGDGFKKHWIRAHARSVLRDEFGRYSSEEVADPTTYQVANADSTQRMNELLEPHGIEIIQIIQPKPKFDAKYEAAIEERKVADQDVERLIAMEDQLVQERKQILAEVEKDKSIEMESLTGNLTRERLEAEREAIRVKKGADAYALVRVAEGEADRAEKVAGARGLTEKYTKEAEGLRARAEALEKRGEVVVREALVQKLATVTFTLLPYSRDPAPTRLEHVDRNQDVGKASGEGDN